MRKTTKSGELELAKGIALAGGSVAKTLEEISATIQLKKKYSKYLGSDGYPDHNKVTGENDLTAIEVYSLGAVSGFWDAAKNIIRLFESRISKKTKAEFDELAQDAAKNTDVDKLDLPEELKQELKKMVKDLIGE
jgi:hypothetical protein